MTEHPWDNLVEVDVQGTWLCEHVDALGQPVPPTRLKQSEGVVWGPPGAVTSAPRRCLICPDCGTYWRVWVGKNVARASIEWNAERQSKCPPRFFRPQRFDIDRIIHAVRQRVPGVDVRQYQETYPDDDEGRWTFSLAGVQPDIALEAGGNCPFLVETDDQWSKEAMKAASVEEAIAMVVAYLESAARGVRLRLEGELFWK